MPFGGPEHDTPLKKLMAHGNKTAPPVAKLRPDVPKPLAAVLDKMLAKSPDGHDATPLEVALAMMPFVAGCDLAALLRRAAKVPSKGDVPAVSPTNPYAPSAVADTPLSLRKRANGPLSLWERAKVRAVDAIAIAVALGLVGILFFSVLLRVRTKDGILEVELSGPQGNRRSPERRGQGHDRPREGWQ